MSLKSQEFYNLSPKEILDFAEKSLGFQVSGEYRQLNSYENRVYDLFLEEAVPEIGKHIILKFYRPGRWSQSAICEEHEFLWDLKHQGISVVAPLKFDNRTCLDFDGIWAAVFSKAIGRMPEELNEKDLIHLGQTLGRMHQVGKTKVAKHRPLLFDEGVAQRKLSELRHWVAPEVWSRYQAACLDILEYLAIELDPSWFLRIHGDCHKGNLLRFDPPPSSDRPQEFFLVDFDDFAMGPEIQDFWMFLSSMEGNDEELNALIEGYELFREFPEHQVAWISPLRGLRIMNYAHWISHRWRDPTFPSLFPQFRDYNYWAEETEILERISWSLQ